MVSADFDLGFALTARLHKFSARYVQLGCCEISNHLPLLQIVLQLLFRFIFLEKSEEKGRQFVVLAQFRRKLQLCVGLHPHLLNIEINHGLLLLNCLLLSQLLHIANHLLQHAKMRALILDVGALLLVAIFSID